MKPANIFVSTEWKIKIGDFGLVRKFSSGSLMTGGVGSPFYAAPEQKNSRSYNPKVTQCSMLQELRLYPSKRIEMIIFSHF